MEILLKNRNFHRKSKFWTKIEILEKNRNFGQKSKFWTKIEILVKNRNFDQKPNFVTKKSNILNSVYCAPKLSLQSPKSFLFVGIFSNTKHRLLAASVAIVEILLTTTYLKREQTRGEINFLFSSGRWMKVLPRHIELP